MTLKSFNVFLPISVVFVFYQMMIKTYFRIDLNICFIQLCFVMYLTLQYIMKMFVSYHIAFVICTHYSDSKLGLIYKFITYFSDLFLDENHFDKIC